MLKAVIFDLDGTIVDSEPMHATANVIALRKYGLDMPEEYYLSFAGTTKYEMMRILNERHNLHSTPEELILEADKQNDILFERDGYTEIKGVCDLIRRLYADGITLAIASSSPYRDINSVLHYFHIYELFEVIISGQDENINPKPAPDIYKLTLQKLGIDANEAVAIEDTSVGILSALGASLHCFAYSNTNSGNQDLSKSCAIINNYELVDRSFLDWR